MEKAKIIYLLRHCSTKDTELGINGAQTDTPLSEKGLLQAKELVPKIAANKYDAIIVSPLQRTYQTIKPFLASLENPPKVVTDPLVIERSLGIFTGSIQGDGLIQADMEKSGKSKTEWKPEGGESTLDVSERAKKFYDRLKDIPGDNILVCSHQNFLRCLELAILQRDIDDENFYSESPPRLETGELRKYELS